MILARAISQLADTAAIGSLWDASNIATSIRSRTHLAGQFPGAGNDIPFNRAEPCSDLFLAERFQRADAALSAADDRCGRGKELLLPAHAGFGAVNVQLDAHPVVMLGQAGNRAGRGFVISDVADDQSDVNLLVVPVNGLPAGPADRLCRAVVLSSDKEAVFAVAGI